MTRDYEKSSTAAEFIAELKADPQWMEQESARENKRLKIVAEIHDEARPLVKDLNLAGWPVDRVSQLVNTSTRYPEAIPVLTDHLERDYRHEIIEGIVRAMTVPEARGKPARVMLRVFRHSDNQTQNIRWVMANALTVIADSGMIKEMQQLLEKERDESIARMLAEATKKAKARRPTI